jgi:kinetochore protein Nuf2
MSENLFQRMSNEYLFPTLDLTEIQLVLEELEIQYDNLKKPTFTIVTVYEQLLHMITSYSVSIQENELLQDSTQFIQFYLKLNNIMRVCGIHNFTLKDLLEPTPKRTRIILSGIINFCKFRQEKIDLFEKLQQHSELMQSKRNTEFARLSDLKKVFLVD